MKIRRIILLLTVLVASITSFAYASDIDQRVRNAYVQIDRGIQSGSLTREEAHRLKNELRNVRDDEARMLADGRLNRYERERLNKELDRLEKHIYRAKTNDNRDYGDRGRDPRHDDRPHHGGAIRVVAGSYGLNCGVPRGNVTSHLAAHCNGKSLCNYRVDYMALGGDPAVGCPKGYIAEWRCGNGPVRSVAAPGEAGFGAVVTLSCP